LTSDNSSHPLDRPGWNSLNGKHSDLAIRGKISARYQPEYQAMAATLDGSEEAFRDLATIVKKGEIIGLIAKRPKPGNPDWKILQESLVIQMVGGERLPETDIDYVELSTKDIPEVLELVSITKPGPFFPRTVELGRYIGIREDGKLVAMAGERFKVDGYTEISAICTLPDYRGRGYATALSSVLVNAILDGGDIPYLHVSVKNTSAIRLYEKLGFTRRKEVPGWALMRV
jgi:predicted GNAT family acetyltransferase